MTATIVVCERCGGPTRTISILGTEIAQRFCEGCGDIVAAEEDRLERARSRVRALERAGATPRLLEQSLYSHPNQEAANRAFAWVDANLGGRRENLWISGPVGLGKTGLAWGIVRELVEREVDRFWDLDEEFRGSDPKPPALLIRWADLLDDLKAAFDADRRAVSGDTVEPSALLARAKTVAVLALDDLGRERPTPWALEKLANLVEDRYQGLRPTIVTSNYSTKELAARLGQENAADGERIVSRLLEGATGIRLEGDSLRRRA